MAEAHISLQNGSNINGGTFALGQNFYWANPANVAVTVEGCGGFCVDDTYTVPAAPAAGQYGLKQATLLTQATNWSFGPEVPNQWNAPGMPHVGNPPMPAPKEREVA
jgi:hypothetical protein